MTPPDGDVTVLLTLKDRPAFTRRWMSYANETRLPFRVLIADGGGDEGISGLLSRQESYPRVSFEYVRYPFDADYARYYAKIADALGRIDTEFVVMADNDDFLVASAVAEAAEFLRAHPDHASCGGQSAMFWVVPEDGDDALVHGQRIDWKRTSDLPSISGETACARIRTPILSAGDPTYYDVKRTAALRRQFETVRDLNLSDLFLVEHLLWFLNSIAGKTKRLAQLYIARQQNSPGSSGETHAGKYGDWLGRMLVPTWSADFGSFLDATAVALSAADGISLSEARGLMVDSYRAEVAPALLRDVLTEPSVSPLMPVMMRMVQRLVDLPRTSAVRRLAQRVYRRSGWLSTDVIYGMEFVARRASDGEEARTAILACLVNGSRT